MLNSLGEPLNVGREYRTVTPPSWVDPDQRPRRNPHWKLLRDGLKTDPDHSDEPDRGP